jgi:hypothetical protein
MSEDVRMEEFELFGAEEVRAFYYSTVFTYIPSIPNRSFSDIDRGAPSLPDAWAVGGRT